MQLLEYSEILPIFRLESIEPLAATRSYGFNKLRSVSILKHIPVAKQALKQTMIILESMFN